MFRSKTLSRAAIDKIDGTRIRADLNQIKDGKILVENDVDDTSSIETELSFSLESPQRDDRMNGPFGNFNSG